MTSKEDQASGRGLAASIMTAALMLPGVQAHAETPPANGNITLGYLNYKDSQSGLDRITVHSPSVSIMAPVAGVWSIGASLVSDDVSGASPRYHTAISGASHMQDHRTAGDASATRYFERGSVTVGAAYSTEHDYVSRALSLQGSLESENKNTTWTVGLGHSDDRIDPVNKIVTNEKKRTSSLLLGVTQVLTANDIAQLTLTHSEGEGYFSDPYKALDNRPRSRDETTLLVRWNHHLASTGGTSRLSYRYYRDSFGVRGHTLGAEYVQPLSQGWTVTPEVRLYSQSAASFYYDPLYDAKLGAPFPPGYNGSGYMSADQRLSGFGAVTLGLKVSKQLDKLWSVDVKASVYQQRGSWRLFHEGSPGLDALRAQTIQISINRQW
ncbi:MULTISPECIES: DUF3570 domain-containing protein [unclassified Duganella]|uniref:DUF3570 domain-containing protein n=1 Tax=unclassified Duganella TaxID=2636909 RepID=UPI000E342A54|nr:MULTISPECIES: DUF3570 domain-containing protein [unclassified Duganella]RFP08338.1 DUF3570 domain-containing protein [Duganella sp. BJB475]RFP22569.1 DUF3570 domain-containing protein [Duganella sp. BJB476]